MKEKNMKELSIVQFAKYCGVNSATVMRWIKDGEIKANNHYGKKDYRIRTNNLSKVKFEKEASIYSHFHHNLEDLCKDPSKEKHKALIIDDDENIIELLSPLFSDNGFQVLSSTNIYNAMILMHEEVPFVLTLDLGMPDTNGTEILKMINNLGIKRKIWVIVISGASEYDLCSAVNLGADFYLSKPFQQNDLDKIIKKINGNYKKEIAS